MAFASQLSQNNAKASPIAIAVLSSVALALTVEVAVQSMQKPARAVLFKA
jgi:hypothetical protein